MINKEITLIATIVKAKKEKVVKKLDKNCIRIKAFAEC